MLNYNPVQIFRLNSLSALILAGFVLAGLPLLWTIWSSIQSVSMLTGLSQQTLLRATQTTQSSRELTEALTSMERNIRQYLVLKDKELLEAYYHEREAFVGTVNQLYKLNLQDELELKLSELVKNEGLLFGLINQTDPNKVKKDVLVREFGALSKVSQDLRQLSIAWVGQQSEELKRAATIVQKNILKNASFLMPVFVLLVILFTYLIAKPIKLLERSIGYISSGDLDKRVKVSGPADIESLGEQLNFLRRKLIKLEEDQQTFLQQVSHELKTPLASINEGTGLLRDEIVGELNGEQLDIVKIMQRSSLQLKEQINTLLEFSRLNAQKSSLSIERVSLSKLINEVIKKQRILLKAKNIAVKTHLPDVDFYVDREKFKMVFDNLLSNAIKYSKQQGEVSFFAENKNNKVIIAIADKGYGFGQGEENKIFDLFYQGWASKEFNVQGNGLGLAIVRDIIEAHAGTIEIDLNYHGGAKFIIILPLELS